MYKNLNIYEKSEMTVRTKNFFTTRLLQTVQIFLYSDKVDTGDGNAFLGILNWQTINCGLLGTIERKLITLFI